MESGKGNGRYQGAPVRGEAQTMGEVCMVEDKAQCIRGWCRNKESLTGLWTETRE